MKRVFPAKQSMWVVTGRKEGGRGKGGREGEQEGNRRVPVWETGVFERKMGGRTSSQCI